MADTQQEEHQSPKDEMDELTNLTEKLTIKENTIAPSCDEITQKYVNLGGFSLENYFENIEKQIYKILSRQENEILTFDILDTEKSKRNKLIVLKEKQRQMKIGEIWQEVLGTYDGFQNLKVGHATGLDLLSHTKKIAIELKNRTNTDNASSKKSNLDKLAKFKEANPEYICIYANINADTEQKTKTGLIKKIKHNDLELEHHVGIKFIQFILGENTNDIINFVRNTIDKYI